MGNNETMSDGKFQTMVNTKLEGIFEQLKDKEQRLRKLERPKTVDVTHAMKEAERIAVLEQMVKNNRRVIIWAIGVLTTIVTGFIGAVFAGWLSMVAPKIEEKKETHKERKEGRKERRQSWKKAK